MYNTIMQNKAKSTLIVNLFAGPGCGKSTHAGGTFYRMKRSGINCEYIQEYAKDKTWSEDVQTLLCQPYVTGKQFYRTSRLLGKVDVAITDSPVITGILYQGFGCTPSWEKWAIEAFNEFNNLNIFLVRNTDNHPYNTKGRSQTEDEARAKDNEMRAILDKYGIPYEVVEVTSVGEDSWDDAGLDTIFKLIQNRLIKERLKAKEEELKELKEVIGAV